MLHYAYTAKAQAINAIIVQAHDLGDEVHVQVVKELFSEGGNRTDSSNTIPDHLYNPDGTVLISFCPNAIGSWDFQSDSGCIWLQTAFNGKRTEIFIPVGSISAVLVNRKPVWVANSFFILDEVHTAPEPELVTEGNVVHLFGKK